MNPSWSGPGASAAESDSLATPFEDWCGARGIHPDAFGAWECFEASRREQVAEQGH